MTANSAPTARPELDGLVALVTGGSRNVGKVIAKRLAVGGATVIVNYFRSPADARTTCAEIEASGGRAFPIRASVAQPDQLDRMFAEIEAKFGRLDILVNNAAYGALVSGAEVTDELLDRALDTNLKGSLGCARRARPLMVGNGGGSIINLSTLGGGQFVMAGYLACGPAKAAVESLTRYLAVEFAPDGIRVNTAAAGMLDSEVASLFPRAAEMRRAVVGATPLGRLGRPEEFAEVVAFLASSRASWITGQLLLADGGMSTGHALLSPGPIADPRVTREEPVETPGLVADEAIASLAVQPGHGSAYHVDGVPAGVDRVPAGVDRVPASFESLPAGVEGPAGVESLAADVEDEIAVVGMGITVAGANDPDQFWDVLMNSGEFFIEVPPDRWDNGSFHSAVRTAEDKTYSDRSAFITGFEPHPRLAAELASATGDEPELESTTLWLRHALVQALDGVAQRPRDAHAFLVGYTADGSQHLEEATVRSSVRSRIENYVPAEARTSELDTRLDEAIARCYPHSGPEPSRFLPHQVAHGAMRHILPEQTDVLVVDTACSSSLYAIDIGRNGLLDGRYDIAVCGGAFSLGPRGSILFAKLNGLSARGEVRSLERDGDGVLFADGAAVVVLKRLSRARADGDRILATLRAFGSSSDGKGKAIYAPSAAGQKLAISRALQQVPQQSVEPEWVVAHATGTPAGDLAEFTTLRETFVSDDPIYVTSNKSVIGHTGWAAGAVSLIEVVLAMRHGVIPPQHRFIEPPADFRIDSTNLEIPVRPIAWPARGDGQRRMAAVSGFGFGGTNAHLLVEEPPPVRSAIRAVPAPESALERIAIVALAAHLPGGHSSAQVLEQISKSGDQELERSFGDTYPIPSFERVRLPPAMMRAIDRCQLMILECAHELREQLGAFWDEQRLTTGVILGHMGSTRNATHYATRCYLDDLKHRLPADQSMGAERWLPSALAEVGNEVRRLVPPSNEDTFPGMMPNVIPARVANFFDLRGLNMTVDTGFTSALSAVDLAIRYLRTGALSVALAGGISGNSTAEMREILSSTLGPGTELAEGAFLFALTTERAAQRAGLPVLGFVDTRSEAAGSTAVCGARAPQRRWCYLGGEGGFGLVRALKALPAGGTVAVRCDGGEGAPDAIVQIESAELPSAESATHYDASDEDRARGEDAARGEGGKHGADGTQGEGHAPELAAVFYDDQTLDGVTPLRIARHAVRLQPDEGERVREPLAFWPDEPTILLTNRSDLVDGVPDRPHTVVLSTAQPGGSSQRPVPHLTEPTVEKVRHALGALPEGPVHVRVLVDLTGIADEAAVDALHELAFLVVQNRFQSLGRADSSCLGLVLWNPSDPAPPPLAGLFTGLFKVIRLELPECRSFVVLSNAATPADGAEQVRGESARVQGLPVVHYLDGVRSVPVLQADPGRLLPPTSPRLRPDSVVVAVGGGRGITAELMIEVARQHHCRIVLIGSNQLDVHPKHYMALDDEAFAAGRAEFIRTAMRERPGTTPKQANILYQRIADARVTVRNIARMTAHSGVGRVSYVTCDVTDTGNVETAMNEILRCAGPIDLLVNAAGLNRSAPLSSKSLEEFRRVRDLKVHGYRNLKAALRKSPPRIWCNFGSLLGMTGQVGEADYASANDFLALASVYHSAKSGEYETTIGWTLWAEVGLGANELTKAYFEKSGLYSAMSTAEGAHHFIRELAMAEPEPLTIHLGDAERAAIDRLVPGFLRPTRPLGTIGPDQPAARPTPLRSARPADRTRPLRSAQPADRAVGYTFYADRILAESTEEIVFERVFDLAADPYLRHHLVGGVPTLPGTFVTEIAFEVASRLVPDQQVFALEDVRFEHFLKVRESDRPTPRRIIARVVERRVDLAQTTVEVLVVSDVVAPNGTVLVKNRPHFRTRVRMAGQLPEAPLWQPWPDAAEVGVDDPYHADGSPVKLTGMFVCTTGTRLHPWGKRAVYRPRVSDTDPVFSRFGLPTILLDGLARTGVLALLDDELIPLAAPLGIRRVDVYEHINDCQIRSKYGEIDLYAVVSDEASGHQSANPHNHFAAVRPDGRVLSQMKDLSWTVMGFLRSGTGEFLTPGQAALLVPSMADGAR